MHYFRKPTFWGHLFVGWFVTVIVVGAIVACAGVLTSVTRRLDVPVWIIVAAVNVLALVSGWEFARQRAGQPDQRGFPIDSSQDEGAD